MKMLINPNYLICCRDHIKDCRVRQIRLFDIHANLRVKVQRKNERSIEEGYKMAQTKVDLEVEYSMSSSRFWRVGKGFIYFFVAVVGCWWLWSVGQYQRRNHAVDRRTCPLVDSHWAISSNILLPPGDCSCTSSSRCASVSALIGLSSSRCSRLRTHYSQRKIDMTVKTSVLGCGRGTFIERFRLQRCPRRRADADHQSVGHAKL